MRCQNWPCRVVAGKTGTARGKDRSPIPANQPSCARLSGVDRREAIRGSRDPHGAETSLSELVHWRHFYPVPRKLLLRKTGRTEDAWAMADRAKSVRKGDTEP